MAALESVADILAAGNADHPDAPATIFEGATWTYRDLWEASVTVGRGLSRRGVGAGTPVVIALPNGVEFLLAFFGTSLVGGVAVPTFPRTTPERLGSLADLTGASLIVRPDDAPPGSSTVSIGDLRDGGPSSQHALRRRSDTCYIQFTSGSTADPRGVLITHQALLTNIDQMVEAMAITADDVFVSWLPTYHDMGLTLMALTPLRLGSRLVLLPTQLSDVSKWLWSIEAHEGTFTAGPDFAYRLCCRRIPPHDRPALSSLQVAMNASEPVRLSTMQDFEAGFGLDRVMMTGYGLAEATLSVTCTSRGAPMEADERGLVCLGAPVPGTSVAIVRDDVEQGLGVVGDIMVRGPSNTSGYHRNEAATRALQWQDGYIRTGDTGYLDASGCLHFAARHKDVLEVAGRTIYPQEVEEIVDAVRGVRVSAAVGLDDGSVAGEQLFVFAEARSSADDDDLERVARKISRELHEVLGLRPRRVHLLRPRTIPLTENGKLRREALREAVRSGDLMSTGKVLFPPT